MSVTWFKRYRMHFDLVQPIPARPDLVAGYQVLAWDHELLDRHAQAKYYSFRHEIDANVFPCLSRLEGCRQLMQEITQRSGFIPQATWLAVCQIGELNGIANCGTVQGINLRGTEGSIQNLGVAPDHRGRGLAKALLAAALQGFQQCGMTVASLEVTARNHQAIEFYQRFGFRIAKSVYKSIEIVGN